MFQIVFKWCHRYETFRIDVTGSYELAAIQKWHDSANSVVVENEADGNISRKKIFRKATIYMVQR
jgi:hypothetical protein